MLEDDDGPDYADQQYVMIVNCRHGYDLTASQAQQNVQVSFDFAGTDITSLQRMNRQTGQVELITDGGSYDDLTYIKTGATT